jgi:hypothetical protein
MKEYPVFYLGSSENDILQEIRACTDPLPLPGRQHGDGYLVVQVEPAIMGQQFGLGGRDIDCVVLAPRHASVTLMPLSESPAAVHVAMLLIPVSQALHGVTKGDLRLLAWGEVYATVEEARRDLQRVWGPYEPLADR